MSEARLAPLSRQATDNRAQPYQTALTEDRSGFVKLGHVWVVTGHTRLRFVQGKAESGKAAAAGRGEVNIRGSLRPHCNTPSRYVHGYRADSWCLAGNSLSPDIALQCPMLQYELPGF